MRCLPAALLICCALLGGCWSGGIDGDVKPEATPSSSPMPSDLTSPSPAPTAEPIPLMTVEIVGGECPSGPCDRLINVDADGRLHEVIPKDRTVGQVSPELIDALQVEMGRANFQQIRSNPFTGTCPTAVDGQELIYTFHLLSGDREIRSCKVAIDPNHPLFQAVAAVLAALRP
jgi:hypothetical protein